eukprot:CAMPEP_0119311530 /NCGR_PEP_ID=MMETSP1333-20130426/22772_1 /TAXON_ID=418940 /ORGANISM="Scyphosphaera apsteinii, Strain RCC1455" /LENGTH=461 /DNA_ID=CAMNT_0007315929 /DNA_START=39 /DNA_END=1424 /DNA_ORIENTATION=+
MPKKGPVTPLQYREGATYTGVDEYAIGHRPGIFKTTVQLSYGVYKTRDVKLSVEYCGFDQNNPCEEKMKLTITLPEKWLDNPTPVSALRNAFIKAYRKKFPNSRLGKATDEEWCLSIKDESMMLFSKKRVPDDGIITHVFYDRQEIWAMTDPDWEDSEKELKRMRKIIVDDLAKTMKSVKHDPEEIVPVMSKKQIMLGQTYVILYGWYKQHCIIVQPEFTVADIKAYLHHKDGPRLPMESIDIALRRGDDVHVLDSRWSLQKVYEFSLKKNWEQAALEEEEEKDEKGEEEEEDDDDDDAFDSEEDDEEAAIEEWDERKGWTAVERHDDGTTTTAGNGNFAKAADAAKATKADEDEIVLDTEKDASSTKQAVVKKQTDAVEQVPSVMGKTILMGVGKRIQDRKHQIWLPQVHDPWSFRTPHDEAPSGGSRNEHAGLLSAPRGWSSVDVSDPSVNKDEQCSIM